jgi:hypothetical protein
MLLISGRMKLRRICGQIEESGVWRSIMTRCSETDQRRADGMAGAPFWNEGAES